VGSREEAPLDKIAGFDLEICKKRVESEELAMKSE
jgi:hypothetical protein